jgi:hypothetical protein
LTFAVTPEFRVTGGVRDTKDQKSFNGTFEANTIICTIKTPFGPSCPQAGVLPYTQLAVVPAPYRRTTRSAV